MFESMDADLPFTCLYLYNKNFRPFFLKNLVIEIVTRFDVEIV